jgi:hypothetical protein
MAWRRTAHTEERDEKFLLSPDALTLNARDPRAKQETQVTFVAHESGWPTDQD